MRLWEPTPKSWQIIYENLFRITWNWILVLVHFWISVMMITWQTNHIFTGAFRHYIKWAKKGKTYSWPKSKNQLKQNLKKHILVVLFTENLICLLQSDQYTAPPPSIPDTSANTQIKAYLHQPTRTPWEMEPGTQQYLRSWEQKYREISL